MFAGDVLEVDQRQVRLSAAVERVDRQTRQVLNCQPLRDSVEQLDAEG